ncbi:GUN4 domain-containing protein [Pseudanabaena sp. Chao 1811]|uniref:GUN4 domain-containing protein n=1 Tax=Pseudanabaena sp. Chao 1811 TaxID=2963092 RepID=UPI0022F3B4FF|nr:GUN4 domain-containing protein [Pseudanabaena sp. Chao 1811]
MARNFAVVVGINNYKKIQPLKYAKSDAEKMRDFFMQDLQVSPENLYFFSDDSPCDVWGRDTQPTYSNLETFFTESFETPFLESGDTLWFYFSGHGMPYEGRDCLLPIDFSLSIASKTTIPLSSITDRLRRSGADNVVMLIDACRSDGAKNAGMGIGEEKQQGVITFFSCSPSQVSYEIDEIGQGAFTNVLLEALRIQGEGNCATVERFANYLKFRVPKLTQRYKNYAQTPYVVVEPETKLHYILLPKFANLTDIALLREHALQAEIEEDFTLAFQLWMRINVASGGTDIKVINAFQRLANKQSIPNSQLKERFSDQGSKKSVAPPVPEVKKNPVELVSAKGIDYRELEKLLKSQEWRKADELTAKLIHQFAYREKEGCLDSEKIEAFPCEDLRTIDQLWVHYSNSKFGFSIQKKLWLDCGGEIGKFDHKVFKKFASKVGWYHPQRDNWRTHTEFINDTKNTQDSLLASFPKMLRFYKGSGDGGYDDLLNGYLFSLRAIFSLAMTYEL